MPAIKKNISLEKKVYSGIEKQRRLENRSFSNMIETMAKKYLEL